MQFALTVCICFSICHEYYSEAIRHKNFVCLKKKIPTAKSNLVVQVGESDANLFGSGFLIENLNRIQKMLDHRKCHAKNNKSFFSLSE